MSSANISSQQSLELEPESEQPQKKTSPKKSQLPGWFLAILLIGGGVGLWQMSTTDSAPTAESSTQAPPPKSVETIALTSGTGNRQVRLLGQVEAGERATLSPQLDGTIQRVLVREGDRSLEVFLEVPESLSGQVAPGMRVNLNARALPNWQQETEITAVVPTANTASRRQLVRVSLDNPPPGLLPGMAIQANLAVPVESTDTFIVPRDALTRRGNEWLLFVVDRDRAQQLGVEILSDLGQEVVIANPELREGQDIVVTGGDGLTGNAAVQVVSNE